jgi:hypothetical protein
MTTLEMTVTPLGQIIMDAFDQLADDVPQKVVVSAVAHSAFAAGQDAALASVRTTSELAAELDCTSVWIQTLARQNNVGTRISRLLVFTPAEADVIRTAAAESKPGRPPRAEVTE